MRSDHKQVPTDSELEILQILWEDGPSTVRYVHTKLSAGKEVRYTTTLKTMQVMAEKGMLLRNEDQRSHVYSPALEREDTQQALLDRFLEKAFSGSASTLVMQALGKGKTSREELEKIKQIIKDLERSGK